MFQWLTNLLSGSQPKPKRAQPRRKANGGQAKVSSYTREDGTRVRAHTRTVPSVEIPKKCKEEMAEWLSHYSVFYRLGNTGLDTCYRNAMRAYKAGDYVAADGWLGVIANQIGQHEATSEKRLELRFHSFYKPKLVGRNHA